MELLQPFLPALAGGMLIGLSAVALMALTGRIAGISGIAWNAASAPLKNGWAVLFLLGLALGAFGYHLVTGVAMPVNEAPLANFVVAGLLVGIGTRVGSGCTSGHGICGLARLSPRSMVAVVTFMIAGFVTVFLRLHGPWS